MEKHTNITEEDIFNFIFSPDKLPKVKFNYLTANQERFQNEIALCRELINSDNTDYKSLTDKILEQINSRNIIELYQQKSKPIEENGIKLAAASVLTESPRNTFSFVDSESKYLIRIVKTDLQNLLYLFTDDKKKEKFKVKLYPSEAEYNISNTSQPIEILEEKVIDKISIE